jgi:multidrug resistance efflux pump
MINEEKRFLPAAMMFVNQLMFHYRASRASLGWVRGDHMRLAAVSNMQKFDKRAEIIRRLEHAMEESADQDSEITVPPTADATGVTRDHEIYLQHEQIECAASFPLRVDGKPVGVLTIERSSPFETREILALRLTCDVCGRRLDDLHHQSKWFGARLAAALRARAAAYVGFEHTWWKLSAILGAVAVAVLLFWPWHYRVEAPFTLRTEKLAHIPAPYDGFIDAVLARIGDEATQDQVLLELDRRDLAVQQSESMAKKRRYENEAKIAQASGKLADAHLALVQAQEIDAELELINHRLDLASVRAPLHGIIVEGDWRERIGSPIAKGDVLFRMAMVTDLYVRLEVPERDIHEVRIGAPGEIAFAGRPGNKYPFVVERIYPTATTKNEGSVFYVRGKLLVQPDPWWRPGMTGVSKIGAGDRSILWVLTHRLVDFIRMKLWL